LALHRLYQEINKFYNPAGGALLGRGWRMGFGKTAKSGCGFGIGVLMMGLDYIVRSHVIGGKFCAWG